MIGYTEITSFKGKIEKNVMHNLQHFNTANHGKDIKMNGESI